MLGLAGIGGFDNAAWAGGAAFGSGFLVGKGLLATGLFGAVADLAAGFLGVVGIAVSPKELTVYIVYTVSRKPW